MKFNIAMIEPPHAKFAHFLYDPMRCLQYGIESLGHNCTLTRNNLDATRINLVMGGHQIADPASVDGLLKAKTKYILLQSEVIRDGQVNSSGEGHWKLCYLPLLRGALRIWDWSVPQVAEHARLGLAADHLQIGYHPAVAEIHHKAEKDIGVLFFGSITEHRRRLLEALVAKKVPMRVVFDALPIYRNDLIARARIILTLQQAKDSHLNYARVLYAVNNRCLVAGERAREPHWIDPCFVQADEKELADLLLSLLSRDDLDAMACERLEKLKAFPTTAFVAPLLENIRGLA
ncbi:MAG: hypothetical protein ABSC94_31340 [Polyangiaceae bacterium]